MMISIADAASQLLAQAPVPILLIDTCSFIDLFRRDEKRFEPRVPAQEIQAATDLLELVTALPQTINLIVPELVPREYAEHADREEWLFDEWTMFHDQNQDWLAEASLYLALAMPSAFRVQPLGVAAKLRALANELLAKANVLSRDQQCLDRAVVRLINKTRPSHKKEMKDSMNLEQCLELSRRLHNAGFAKSRVWVSPNKNDFAQAPTSTQLHPDLQADFMAAGLRYFTSIRAAMSNLRAGGEIP